MNISSRFPTLVIVASLLLISASVQAQTTPRYKDEVVENPNAEQDIKLVSDFVNAVLVTYDQAKARSLASPAYMGHGPAASDSATIDQALKVQEERNKTQVNRKANFVSQTFRVTSGAEKGDWVSQWGDYTFTDTRTGKTISFPYQYTAQVANGKIMRDRSYYDALAILVQLGYKVVPPEVAKK